MSTVAVATVVREVLECAYGELGVRAVDVDLADGLVIQGSPSGTRRLLLKLLLNAAKGAPADGVIELVAERSGLGVAIRICDRGPGPPKGLVFTTVQDPEVQELAASMQGLAVIVPRVGGGTEAAVWLPCP